VPPLAAPPKNRLYGDFVVDICAFHITALIDSNDVEPWRLVRIRHMLPGIFLENEDWGCKKVMGMWNIESRRLPTKEWVWGGGSASSPENYF